MAKLFVLTVLVLSMFVLEFGADQAAGEETERSDAGQDADEMKQFASDQKQIGERACRRRRRRRTVKK